MFWDFAPGVFDGVPLFEINKEELSSGINIADFLTTTTTVFPSKGEARKMIVGGGVSLNKQKVENETLIVTAENLINNKYLLIQNSVLYLSVLIISMFCFLLINNVVEYNSFQIFNNTITVDYLSFFSKV